MPEEHYFLPDGYALNIATSFDDDAEIYWDEDRLTSSLAYQAAVYEWALILIKTGSLRSVADFGCGNAAKLSLLHSAMPSVETWGFDQPNAIRSCRRHHDFGRWFEVNLDQPIDLPDKRFDLIVASDVIEHLGNPDSLLEAIRHVAHEKSVVLLSTPERIRLRGNSCSHSPNPYHVREWSKQEFASYLRSRDFEILEQRMLPAFKVTQDLRFFRRALRRWSRLKSISYNQAVLAKVKDPTD